MLEAADGCAIVSIPARATYFAGGIRIRVARMRNRPPAIFQLLDGRRGRSMIFGVYTAMQQIRLDRRLARLRNDRRAC
jgi:hypothetical protein